MDEFTNRQHQIIQILNREKQTINSSFLCAELKVSKRTLIKDIAAIDREKDYILSSKRGYRLNPEYLDTIHRWNTLQQEEDDSYELLKLLLISKKPLSIQTLSDRLNLSDSAIQKTARKYNEWLKNYDVQILRKDGALSLMTDERGRRQLVARIVHRKSKDFFSDFSNLQDYFPDLAIEDALSIINRTLNDHGYRINEYYIINFYLNLFAILSYSEYRKGVPEHTDDPPVQYDKEKIAAQIVDSIERSCFLIYQEKDQVISSIAQVLYGFIDHNDSAAILSASHLPDGFISDIREIIEKVLAERHLEINYESFLNVFCLHLNEMIERCKHSASFTPSGLSIKQTNPYVYDVAVGIAGELSEKYSISIPDSEINLIAIHIGYAIEQSENYNEKAEVIIVSDNYHGIADKIVEQIRLIYDNQVIIQNIYPSLQEVPFNELSRCFVISTMPSEAGNPDICFVSPFFTLEDQKKLSEKMLRYTEILRRKEFSRMFYEYVSYDSFLVIDKKIDKYQAIHTLCEMALKDGIVNPDFEKHVLARESLSSTAFYNKFAIPHSDVQEAKKTKLYIMVDPAGVDWDDQKAYIVFLIVIDQNASKEFRKLYNTIIETLYSGEIDQNIDKIGNANDFIRFIVNK